MEWQDLLKTALMGTERQTPAPPQAHDALTTVLSQLNWSQPEQALLGAAGAIAHYQQVGQCPTKQELPAVEPCPLDDLPVCSPRTAQHLNIAFEEYQAVIPELLGLLAAAGERVPEQWLPKLLRLGERNLLLRPPIVAVLGKRGQWLAAQNPAWTYGRGQKVNRDSLQAWQQGNLMERSLCLRRWREVEPDAARQALEAVWASELAEEREGLMMALVHNLSMADEPFLENALDDRAQGVRKLAVELLVQLPKSRLCQRMAQRVQLYVQLHHDGTGLRIEVTLPKSAEDWARDGIDLKSFKGAGKRAWGLRQLLASVPLSVWSEPEAVVRAAADHEWRDVLVEGWGLAAVRQKNREWADALVSQFGAQKAFEEFALLTLLTPERREQLLQTTLPPQTEDEALLVWLQQVTQSSQTFSLGFSRLVWEQLFNLIKTQRKNSYPLLGFIKRIAVKLHPDMTAEVAQALAVLQAANRHPDMTAEVAQALAVLQADQSAFLRNALNELLRCLRFRLEIHQAFANRR